MLFYVVRHGQTEFNKLGLYQGRKDIPLNDTGIEQAKEAAVHLKNILGKRKIDVILVSPLRRAIQTAEPISEVTNVTPIICNGIVERSFGNLEGEKPRQDLTNRMMLDFKQNCSSENIEPIQDLFKRVYTTMDEIVDKYAKKEQDNGKELNIVLVTHGAVTIALECYFNGEPDEMDYDTLECLAMKNAEVRIYDYKKNKRRVEEEK